jgi:hypothetical protein
MPEHAKTAIGRRDGRRPSGERALERSTVCRCSVRREHDLAVADAKAALGEDAFAAAWARGQAMTPEEIVEFAANAVREGASERRG